MSLDLSENAIGDAGACALAASPILARVRTLELSHGQIGDAGARALVESPYLRHVSTLFLHENAFPELAIARLRARFGAALYVGE
jgi:hypothetical protein